MAGKRGINHFRFRGIAADATYTHYEDRPQFDDVERLADKYIGMFIRKEIDRVDVAYTRFINAATTTGGRPDAQADDRARRWPRGRYVGPAGEAGGRCSLSPLTKGERGPP